MKTHRHQFARKPPVDAPEPSNDSQSESRSFRSASGRTQDVYPTKQVSSLINTENQDELHSADNPYVIQIKTEEDN